MSLVLFAVVSSLVDVRTLDSSGAIFDRSGRYRFLLWRMISGASKRGTRVTFVMLNPNQADEQSDDPTIRRCIGFARRWGYERLQIVNLFALRSPEPRDLILSREPIGHGNDRYIVDAVAESTITVAAWGNYGAHLGRDQQVVDLIKSHSELYCLGLNQTGQPKHPLYLRKDAALLKFDAACLPVTK